MFLALLLWLSPAFAGTLPNCDNPQDAANTLLALLQPEDYRPEEAASCLDLPPGQQDRGPQIAVQLKQVLDARGHWIPVPDLSADPAWRPEEGDEVVLVDELPIIYLEIQSDGRWLWSRDTVQATSELHAETFHGLGNWLQNKLPPSFTTTRMAGVQAWQALLLFGLLLLGGLASLLMNAVLRSRLIALVGRLGLTFDPAVFEKTRNAMRLLCFGGVLLIGVPELQLGIKPSLVLLFVARVIVSVSVVVITIRWIDVFAQLWQRRASDTESRMDDQAVPLISKMARIAVVCLGIVFVLSNLGIDVKSLIAGLGIGGLALALGAQDTLSNLFGSLTIFADRPFQVGDYVIVDGVEGTIEEVGFRSTRIRTLGSSIVTVPNSKMANAKIENFSSRTSRRVKTVLGLTYDTPPDKIDAFVAGVRGIIEAHDKTVEDSATVTFRDFSASSLDVLVIFSVDVDSWAGECEARSAIFLDFLKLAETQGVSFAFPSQSLYVESLPDKTRA